VLKRRVREPSEEPIIDLSRPVDRTILRRRTPARVSQASQESQDEFILDKHRKLFEETDPERQLASQSQAQGVLTQRSLMDMVEEADRQRSEALEKVTSVSRKRKAREAVENDREDERGDETPSKPASKISSRGRSAAPPSKKRTLQKGPPANMDAVTEMEEPPPALPPATLKSSKKGPKATQGPRQLDTDETFLVALASMKKGKKKEEQTDRDFNSLKIAKPVIRNDDAEIDMLAWELLPKNMDIRGNFMVCMENIQVREGTQSRRHKYGKPEWVGRPDFKKFCKVGSVYRIPPLGIHFVTQKVPKNRDAAVELVANLSLEDAEEDKGRMRQQCPSIADLSPDSRRSRTR